MGTMRALAPGKVVTVDFETESIEPRPKYPPRPVGVALLDANNNSRYLAWGHPVKNNCTFDFALCELTTLWHSDTPLLFHNAKFDLEVANEYFDLPLVPRSGLVHDTMILGFLHNSRAEKLGLKDLADKYLKLPPVEQLELRDWILSNVPKATPKNFGAYISLAPGDLVGKYALGDVLRTKRLYERWMNLISNPAYERECALIPILIEMERCGLPVDIDSLAADTFALEQGHEDISKYLKKKLGDIDLDSPKQLADALEANNYITDWVYTPKGNKSTSKASLDIMLRDDEIKGAIKYRRSLGTCLRTFIKPWLKQAHALDGKIACTWYQVRQPSERKRGLVGTRTGRLSSSPNFQNMPNPFKDFILPDLALPELPRMRSYIAPPYGTTLGQADYSQQELRILAHYVGGLLAEAYRHDANIDVHALAQELINKRLGTNFERKQVKNTGFGLIYGMGINRLAESIETDIYRAKKLRDEYLNLFQGIRALYNTMFKRAKMDLPIKTWGGRYYYCEEPKIIGGKRMTFEYKMVNVLIQGSAADATKEALVRYHRQKPNDVDIILTVHDEIVILIHSVDPKYIQEVMRHLSKIMSSLEFDVPMSVDYKTSSKSFADLM
jgi:DNA polymerase-1